MKMNKKIYYIDFTRQKRATAGAKAPTDIAQICDNNHFIRLELPPYPQDSHKLKKLIWIIFHCTRGWRRFSKCIDDNSVVIYQHPFKGNVVAEKYIPRLQKRKNVRFIALIHDLESLRGGIAGVIKNRSYIHEHNDNDFLKLFDIVICHNNAMKGYLVSRGFDERKLVTLELFDYLTDYSREPQSFTVPPTVVIAGNLAPGKCEYIYKIKENNKNKNLPVNLYGINYDENKNLYGMCYKGVYAPEELISKLEGHFGLVWDGLSTDTCSGNTGEYLKYNNPHKLSLYLVSNLPVIVWSEAAIASFVEKNQVGIVVDNIEELDRVLSQVTEDTYTMYIEHTKSVSQKLRNGYYFVKAVNDGISRLESL